MTSPRSPQAALDLLKAVCFDMLTFRQKMAETPVDNVDGIMMDEADKLDTMLEAALIANGHMHGWDCIESIEDADLEKCAFAEVLLIVTFGSGQILQLDLTSSNVTVLTGAQP